MKEKSPALQWYPKQALGDDKILAMDWDARGMHWWLLNISWQQQPAGTVPDDAALIRRWLGSPSEDIWRRVSPQVYAAWPIADSQTHPDEPGLWGRRVNAGMVRAAQRQQAFSESRSKAAQQRWNVCNAYASANGVRKRCENTEDEHENNTGTGTSKELNGDDLVFEVLRQIGISARNSDLTTLVADCLNTKGAEPGWSVEKAGLHFIERGCAYKASWIWNTHYKKSWIKWFQDQCYDQDPKAWTKQGAGNDNGNRKHEQDSRAGTAAAVAAGVEKFHRGKNAVGTEHVPAATAAKSGNSG